MIELTKEIEMSNAALMNDMAAHLEDLHYALSMYEGVMVGEPWVIQMAKGAYLVSKGEGYGPGSILRSVCYSPARIDAAVKSVRENVPASLFPNVKKIDRRDALREEIAAHEDIIRRMKALEAA